MLKEIRCSRFKQNKIEFHSGLNVIMGDNLGTNSIGKSSFLMIIDFVFGGNTYVKLDDINNNIGSHTIQFCFLFDNDFFYFSRSTDASHFVNICDENYNIKNSIKLDEFHSILCYQYSIDLNTKITFREIVGRYIRVYGKDNLSEKKPLHASQNEPGETAIISLMKLFDVYQHIREFDIDRKKKSDILKAYTSAQSYDLIPNITKRDYDNNQKEIKILDNQIELTRNDISNCTIDLPTEQMEQLLEIKDQLNQLKRKRSKCEGQLKSIDSNNSKFGSKFELDVEELKVFFPNADLNKLQEVELFHKDISNILINEIKEQEIKIKEMINIYNDAINKFSAKLKLITENDNPSKLALLRLVEIQKKKDILVKKNNSYDSYIIYKKEKLEACKLYKAEKTEKMNSVVQSINSKIEEINNFVYNYKKIPPMLKLLQSGYEYSTINDTGTGTQYKNLIEFDIAILNLTILPILVHDSLLFKNIADGAIDKILQLYEKCDNKQIFIALDKGESYFQSTKLLLDKNCVLELGPNNNELFGYSWNNTK